MVQEINTIISTSILGGVNCYLIKADSGYILIDTGYSTSRTALEKDLESAGCKPGNLKLVILTHGDVDHTGNCAYLQEKYKAMIAMHKDDSGMAERGDMSYNRKPNPVLAIFLKKMPLIFRMISFFSPSSKYEGFKPDITIDEGSDLSKYGFDANIVRLPGHSKGSIGVLTAGGDLFCGDLLENMKKPVLNSIMDDKAAANASVEKLKRLKINTVYPGHGKPFPIELFIK
jgi:hydroxyacylglutathione hydrolase